ncbi:MAG: ATP-binding protein [Treponema sp.]|nr:ATP-binding protein [Treponema sp.]
MTLKKLPIGIQSFEDIRKNNYLYVDKTEHINNLIQNGKVYFLSRPRRFGKSLLVSTIKSYFLGQKDLFKGLKIEKYEKTWDEYPVFHFDFTGKEYNSRKDLEENLRASLKKISDIYNISSSETAVELVFSDYIRQASEKTKKNVVILVDEYDKPILEVLENQQLNDEIRKLLKAFFGVLKKNDEYIKFVFITGVSKFSKVSIFSDLNQINDITFSSISNSICGITQEELELYFSDEILALSEELNISKEECLKVLKQKYDGYHFSKDLVDIYNPYSLLKTFSDKFLGTYWFETGTPTFRIKQLENNNYDLYNFTDGVEYSIPTLMNKSDADFDIVQLLYQTGYITIKEWNKELNTFILRYPNDEVAYSFLSILLPSFFKQDQRTSDFWIREFYKDIKDGNVDSFMTRLKSIIASIPYATEKRNSEHDFQIAIYLVFTLLGQFTIAECYTNKGRIDCVVETKSNIYIFEFKLDKTADIALQQIQTKNYEDKYKSSKKEKIKIGVSFDSSQKKLTEWKII